MPPAAPTSPAPRSACPHSAFIENNNLGKVCNQADLKAGTCPKGSVYGHAKAWTPLLDKPLEGPVYLGVGYGHTLPDLVADLNGQIRILLHAKSTPPRRTASATPSKWCPTRRSPASSSK